MERDAARIETPPGGQVRGGAFAPTPLVSARPPVGTWLAVTLLALAIAMIKPWATDPAVSPTSGAVGEGRAVTGATGGAEPTPARTLRPDSAGPLVALFCLDPPSWRIATIERWRDQTIRVWRAIEPTATASGPNDARIPIFPIVSEGVTELGWCAPVVGPDRPAGMATVDVWRRTPSGSEAIRVINTRPTGVGRSFGGLYGPPPVSTGARVTDRWADGGYVFRYREAGRERWFGVELELRPSTSPPVVDDLP